MWNHERLLVLGLGLPLFACNAARSPEPPSLGWAQQVVHKYCVACHSANGQASELNWGDEPALITHRLNIAAKVRLNSMPPPGLPRPDAHERSVLLCWALANSDGCAK